MSELIDAGGRDPRKPDLPGSSDRRLPGEGDAGDEYRPYRLYWQLGEIISRRTAAAQSGVGAVDQLASYSVRQLARRYLS